METQRVWTSTFHLWESQLTTVSWGIQLAWSIHDHLWQLHSNIITHTQQNKRMLHKGETPELSMLVVKLCSSVFFGVSLLCETFQSSVVTHVQVTRGRVSCISGRRPEEEEAHFIFNSCSPAIKMLLLSLLVLLASAVSNTTCRTFSVMLLLCESDLNCSQLNWIFSACHIKFFCVWTQEDGRAQRVLGMKKDDSCLCEVNSTMWLFPSMKFEMVLQKVQTCEGTLSSLQQQVGTGSDYWHHFR